MRFAIEKKIARRLAIDLASRYNLFIDVRRVSTRVD